MANKYATGVGLSEIWEGNMSDISYHNYAYKIYIEIYRRYVYGTITQDHKT